MFMEEKHATPVSRKGGRFTEKSDNYHGLGPELLSQIPDALEHPIITYINPKNRERVISVLDLTDYKGKPIIASIEYSADTDYNGIEYEPTLLRAASGAPLLRSTKK